MPRGLFIPTKISLEEELPIIKLFVDGETNNGIYEKKYSQNSLTFTIDPTFYSIPKQNKIYYKLEGFDEEWKVKNYDYQKITYKDLPVGEYIFKVKNALDANNIEIKSKIIIQNPFWQTLPFYVMIGMLVLSSFALFFYSYKKAREKREQILEQKINERIATISEQKKNIAEMNELLVDKNQKITEQQEKLKRLYAQSRIETMELKKFSSFLIDEYKKPLMHINNELQLLPVSQEKSNIKKEINHLISKILEWDYLGQINLNEEVNDTAIELDKFIDNQIENFLQKAEERNIQYAIQKNTQPLWVSIDVLKFKLLLNYILTDIVKYRQNNYSIWINYHIHTENIFFQIKSNYPLLLENLYNVQHYSPYHQAANVLASLLDIDFSIHKKGNEVFFELNFNPKIIHPQKNIEVGMNWIHAGIIKNLDENKNNILVWSKQKQDKFIENLLPDIYNIIHESDTNLIFSVLKTVKIHILIIYNLQMDEEFLTVLHNVKSKYPNVRMVYISENINYDLEQRVIDLGMDMSIQLPVNKKFMKHKLNQITHTQHYQKQEEKVYDALNKILNIETPNSDEKLIHEAVSIIQDKINDPQFNVKELYKSLGISKIKCYRIFKDILDIPPSEFIFNIKMKKAEKLLENTNLNIAEVSYEIGFNDPKYFSKVFKKHAGKSPKKFKKEKSIC